MRLANNKQQAFILLQALLMLLMMSILVLPTFERAELLAKANQNVWLADKTLLLARSIPTRWQRASQVANCSQDFTAVTGTTSDYPCQLSVQKQNFVYGLVRLWHRESKVYYQVYVARQQQPDLLYQTGLVLAAPHDKI